MTVTMLIVMMISYSHLYVHVDVIYYALCIILHQFKIFDIYMSSNIPRYTVDQFCIIS